ncbi:MAG: hypothetical protein IKQ20_03225 [Bacteroidales bacterium]|nr:hypothetical protein [Bacteroidales bacterium]
MARTLSEIYHDAKNKRDEYLELTEFKNDSKMSVLDAFTWVVSACIWTFENILDVFQTDIVVDIQNRINGTPAYYASALLKYQSGDQLQISDDGTSFSYATVDESKRVVTKVSYSEVQEQGFYDKKLIFKLATGDPGSYERIESDELIAIRSYLKQIAFAGTHLEAVSRKGDILIPRVTVYHDGGITEDELYANIEKSLNDFIAQVDFNGAVYVQKIIDAIQSAEHVVDVYINPASDSQGIFVVQYDDDDNIIPTAFDENEQPTSYENKVTRSFVPNSGYMKQSSGTGEEADFQTWRAAMTFVVES